MGNWSDYPIFLAVAETGSLTAAGKVLGLSQPTVGRRIRALEEHFGLPLLTKGERGLRPTRFGASILANVKRMREEADTIARTSASLDARMAGNVRISATEGLGTQWLPAVMAAFRREHPEVLVDIAVGFEELNLAQREADIALRWGTPGDQNSLIAKRVVTPQFGMFASRAYVEARGVPETPEDLAHHDGVYAMIDTDHPLWLGTNVQDATSDYPPGRVTFRSDSFMAFVEAVVHGYGIGLMPLVTASQLDLLRVLPDFTDEESLYIVAHEDLRRSPRIRAVFDFIADSFARDAEFFRSGGQSAFDATPMMHRQIL